jgi:ABC-2 type transport system ATP-binding protein
MAELGLLLEARSFHPGRSARNHLLALARTAGIDRRRVDDVLDLVGLTAVATKRAGGFSLGMSQRLGVATALLGDPQTIVLDEPMNGLDLDGVRWIRELLRRLAGEGRTVFVSSHLMSEVAQTATQLIVLGRGRLIADCTVEEFVARGHSATVAVRAPELTRLGTHLGNELPDARISIAKDILTIQGATAEQVGMAAWRVGIPVTELTTIHASLEEAFMAATSDFIEYSSPAASEN